MIRRGDRTCFRCGISFNWWSLVRLNCACNSGVDYLSRPEGCDLKAEGLEPYHEYCMSCGCVNSSTSSPWVPFFMCSCILLSPGRFGPSRAQVCVGFAVVGWFKRFRPSPPSAGLVPFPSASVFPFPCPFRVCPWWARFSCVGVSSFPLRLRSPSSRPG